MAYAEAKGSGGRKKLRHLEVSKTANGGHNVAHHYDSGGNLHYEAPAVHTFSKGQEPEMMKHIGDALGIKASGTGAAGGDGTDNDSDDI